MSVIGSIFEIGTIALPTMAAWLYLVDDLPGAGKRRKKKAVKAIEASKIDGRTEQEWYDLIRGMGKEDYERIALAPLDGLERSKEMGWDIKRLMGKSRYDRLMKEWYPEKVFPRTEIHVATNTEWRYGAADNFGVMEVRVTRNGLTARTQILAESFDDVIGMTKDSVYKKLVKTEKEVAEAKERKAREQQKALEAKKTKEIERLSRDLSRDIDWLQKALDKQREAEYAAREKAKKAAERALRYQRQYNNKPYRSSNFPSVGPKDYSYGSELEW